MPRFAASQFSLSELSCLRLFDAITSSFLHGTTLSTTTRFLKNKFHPPISSRRSGRQHFQSPCFMLKHESEVVEVNGIEPMTPCLQSRCSPS